MPSNNISFEDKPSLFLKITGYILVLFGLLLTLLISSFFLIFVSFGLKALYRKGTAINTKDKKYRIYGKLLGITFGQWKQLPKPDYLTLLAAKESQRVWVASASTRVENSFYKINLFYNETEYIEIFRCEHETEAYTNIIELGKILNTNVFDSIHQKWL
ncbi:hypothetical protein [Neptunitalea lumnitzerae]|uniref:Uncharacterized protein n=1 Tax=Neptunitalea lumnitzerae TaxID=2965509 RepID=A0ABQ5MN11_9FLAO|nr:hypothetical protein [Neptunitalea sp. Y10]GLB50785.1 hypothetical protein Y10_31530 [Neptunitalea sp. Y10]